MRCIRCIDLQLGHGGLPMRRTTGDTFLSHQSQGKTVVTPPTRAQPGPNPPQRADLVWQTCQDKDQTRFNVDTTSKSFMHRLSRTWLQHGYSRATAYRLLDCKTGKTWWPGPKPKQDLFSGLGTIHDSSWFFYIFFVCFLFAKHVPRSQTLMQDSSFLVVTWYVAGGATRLQWAM